MAPNITESAKGEIVPQFWVNATPSFKNKPSHKMDWVMIAVFAYQHAHQVGQRLDVPLWNSGTKYHGKHENVPYSLQLSQML
jgi:hypothetical protein